MPLLQWLNDDEARSQANQVPYRLLEEQPKLSYGDPGNQNMLIQGDNLDALKALLPYYAGKVKCIFIDPPYNTKSAFEHYDDNLEHSQWLTLMYPRLELLRELLSEEGSIWVTIDDREAHYLKVLLDEVFGRKNFVSNVIWQKKYAPQNDAKWLSDSHDHVIIFAKNKEVWRPKGLPRTAEMDKQYKNPDNDPRGSWMSDNMSVKTYSEKTDYPIETPSGRIVNPPESRCWAYSKEKLEQLINDDRVWFGKDGKNVPRLKRFLSEVQQRTVAKTIWLRDEVGDNQDSKREVKNFNKKNVFSTPKPEKLIQRILTLATSDSDIVLDSFLGSGTTAAVAHKMNRKYIGIELGEHAKTHCLPRLQKVIDGEQGGISEDVKWQGGGGFHFYQLGEAVFDEEGHINPEIKFAPLAAHIWFSETGMPFQGKADSPFLGIYDGVAYGLLYNGILGDKRPNGGNVLTRKVLEELRQLNSGFEGDWVIYGESSRITPAKLEEEKIIFKQTPYDIKAR